MSSILVTGGAGFIGSNLVKSLLDHGHDIIVIDNFITGYMENIPKLDKLKIVHGDITDIKLIRKYVKQVDSIFHLAASVGNLKSIENPNQDAYVNIVGTLNLLNAAREFKISKIIYSSSSAIYGDVEYIPLDENHPICPTSPYGVSKLAAEKYCLCYSKLYDLDVVCLRYFNVYGINQRFNPYGNIVPIWSKCILDNKPITIYGDGGQTRDFINVADIVQANIKSHEKNGIIGAYNIGSGQAITINKLAKTLQKISCKKVSINYEKPRKGEVLHSEANINKAKKAFNFRPEVPLEKGLLEYLNWIQGLN